MDLDQSDIPTFAITVGIIARQSAKAAVSNYIGVILGFVNLFLLFPLYYSPRDLGAIRLLLELGAIISSFALIGTNYSINRFFPYFKSDDQKHNGFFFWVFSIPILGYAITLIILIFFKNPLLSFFKADVALLSGLYPMLLCLILFSLFQIVLESANANHGRIAVPNFLREVVLRLIILSAGFLFFSKFVSFYTSAWIIVGGYGVVVLFNLLYLKRLTPIHIKPDFHFIRNNPEVKKDALKFTSWLFLGSVTSLIVSKIDFVMISATKSLADTAIYSTGFYLALLIEIPKRTILQISTPIVAGLMKESNFSSVQKMYKQLASNQLLLASLLFFAIWLNIDNLFDIMHNGNFYRQGKWVVFIIGAGRLIDMIGSTASPIMANSKYYAWGLINSVVSICVAIISNYILIPILGITGAALATMLTFFLSQGVSVLIIYVKLKIHPFQTQQIKTVLLLAVFLAFTLTGQWFENPFLDGFVRTGIFLPLMLFTAYYFKLSEELNQQLLKLFSKYNLRKVE